MGKFFIEEPPMKMETIYTESDKCTPIVFVLSPGSDPRQMLLNFAKQMKIT